MKCTSSLECNIETDWIITVGDLHTISNSEVQGDSSSITYTDHLIHRLHCIILHMIEVSVKFLL